MSGLRHEPVTPTVAPSGPTTSAPTTSRDQRQDSLGNNEVQRQVMSGGPGEPASGDADPVNLPGSVAADGALSYYRRRHGDFSTRYTDAGSRRRRITWAMARSTSGASPMGRTTASPTRARPGWCGRGSTCRRPSRAAATPTPPTSTAWRRTTRRSPRSAYGTHADAYWNAGLGDLSPFDLANIGLTPDVRDLVAFDGLTQVADIGSRLLGTWGEDAIDYVAGDGATDELVDVAYEGFGVVGDGIDEVFGEGTAQALTDGADALGQDALALAEDAHGVASEVVGEGVDALDSVIGEEGATEAAIDSARETASDLADGAEAGVDSASAWAEEVWDDIF
ncbi:MAG: hypothetical protein IPI35_20095 [Deltaproteobacteria bacterium]|nr:hypothetical protein [Deltaproteobacteria bacterium]